MRRRTLLYGLSSVALYPRRAVAPPSERGPVDASLDLAQVRVNHRGDWLLVRCHANNGLTGLGDASHGGDAKAQIDLIQKLFAGLKGRSIYEVEWLHQSAAGDIARNPRLAATAVSALEQTLWDLQGKTAGVPVYCLFGGALRTEIRTYTNINRAVVDRTPDGFAEVATRAVEDGFDAVKLAPFDGMPPIAQNTAEIQKWFDLGVSCAEAVRRAIGPKRDLLIDVHSHFHRELGLHLAERLAPLNLFWLEEVTPATPLSDLAAVNEAAPMPTAGGESVYGVQGFSRTSAGKPSTL